MRVKANVVFVTGVLVAGALYKLGYNQGRKDMIMKFQNILLEGMIETHKQKGA